jgi:hypothetical protein
MRALIELMRALNQLLCALIDFNARINQLMRIDSMNTRIKSFKESNT